MRRSLILVGTLISGLLSTGSESWADANRFYRTLASSIKSANAQGDLRLSPGIWRTIYGDSAAVWNIRSDSLATMYLILDNGDIAGSTISFTPKIEVTIMGAQNLCSSFSVGRVEYKEGSHINFEKSDIKPITSGPCANPGGLLALQDHLLLSNSAADLFQGKIFQSLSTNEASLFRGNKVPQISKCTNLQCAAFESGAGPVATIRFYPARGMRPVEALLKDMSTIEFGSEDFLLVRETSRITFGDMFYDVRNQRGNATIDKIIALVDGGKIKAGSTTLQIPRNTNSTFVFDNVIVDSVKNVTQINGGTFTGSLGDGSVIGISTVEGHSYLSVGSGTARLNGIKLTHATNRIQFEATSGEMQLALKRSRIEFTKANYVEFGFADVSVFLGCAPGDNPDTCAPVVWGPNGNHLTAKIGKLNVTLAAGQFATSASGSIQLTDGGELHGSDLFVDTREKETPITGKFGLIKINIATQRFAIDASTELNALHLTLQSTDIEIVKGDIYPTGTMKIWGDLRGTKLGTAGDIPFSKGQIAEATPIVISREKRNSLEKPSSVRVRDGTVSGEMLMSYGIGGQGKGKAQFIVSEIRYYEGQGDAVVSLSNFEFGYPIDTPTKHVEEKGPLGTEGIADVYSIRIWLRLADPIRFPDEKLLAENGKWRLPKRVIPVRIVAEVPRARVVNAEGKGPAGVHLCSAEADSVGKNYVFSGQIEYELSENMQFITIGNFSISEKLQVDLDISSCERVSFIMCTIAGSMVSPLLPAGGEFAGYAAGIFCAKKLNHKIDEETDKFLKNIEGLVRGFHFTLGRQ